MTLPDHIKIVKTYSNETITGAIFSPIAATRHVGMAPLQAPGTQDRREGKGD